MAARALVLPFERWGVWFIQDDGREGWVRVGGLSGPPWSTRWRDQASSRARFLGISSPVTGTRYEVRSLPSAEQSPRA